MADEFKNLPDKEKLKQAGFSPPHKNNKISSKNTNIQAKIYKSTQFLNVIEEYNNRISSTSDKNTLLLLQNSIVLNYKRFCESIKDILNDIAIKENITSISSKCSLKEIIRETINILDITVNVSNAAESLNTDIMYDYINSEYYDNEILVHISNDIDEYKEYLNAIKKYLQSKGMIK